MHAPEERRVLTWLTVCAFIAVLCFTRGFFLVRYEVHLRSTCELPLPDLPRPPANVTGACWHPPVFRRVVVILLDGLRFDFLAWNDSVGADAARHYENKMPFVRRLVEAEAERTLAFRFVSDAPTTTSQRLKGMWTGALPTFLDLKDNFNSAAVEEDNVVAQLAAGGRRELVFMGGDTWDMLFPRRFARSYALPSFNVKDLHTVDDGIERHLEPELRGERGAWDALFVHFEGVDHVGHRHGPDHPAMAAKLAQMDAVLERVVRLVGNDTLLAVLSDHGMTADGNHGGASDDELAAALLLYSPRTLNHAPAARTASERFARARSVPQVDLVPTLSLLLGLPVPFASLGALIPELFLAADLAADRLPSPLRLPAAERAAFPARLRALNWALRLNARQLWRYLSHYSARHRPLPLGPLAARFAALAGPDADADTDAEQEALFDALRAFLADATALCRRLWTAFDEPLMLASAVLAFALLVALLLLLAQPAPLPPMPWRRAALAALLAALPAACLRSLVALPVGALASVAVVAWRLAPDAASAPLDGAVAGHALVLALHGAGLFANSFIEAEHAVLLHLLAFLALTRGLAAASRAALLSLLLVRASALVASEGRHEALATSLPLGALLAALLVPLALALASLRLAHRLMPACPPVPRLALRLLLPLAYASCAAHHALQLALPPDALPPLLRVLFPRLLYAALAALALVAALAPPALGLLPAFLSAALPVPLALLLLGPHAPLQLACFVAHLVVESPLGGGGGNDAALTGVRWGLLACAYFYSTGHAASVSALQMEAAYYGLADFHWLASSLLVFANTFAPLLLPALALPLLARLAALPHPRLLLGWALVFVVRAACTTAFVYGARRHLMVWRVFAPKFLFDATFLLVALAAALLAPAPRPAPKRA